MSRREFTQKQKAQIVERSKDANGRICCERCGLVLAGKQYEIDHIIAEGLRPEADKKAKITIAEGQLLGKECCHRGADGKTNDDVKKIAKSNRQYSKANGLKRKAKPIPSAGFTHTERKHQGRASLPPRKMYREAE